MLKTNVLDKAPIHPEVAEGPSDVRAYWVLASDKVRLRVAHWPTEKSFKGTVFLFQGRTENIEKYGRTVE
ncbi:alpha/beta hydrolase, partial [Ruegeria sp. NA]|nr:alpha/beta hydrolase [Ruegeria sp. NA]